MCGLRYQGVLALFCRLPLAGVVKLVCPGYGTETRPSTAVLTSSIPFYIGTCQYTDHKLYCRAGIALDG